MKPPPDRKYAETHEWFLADENVVTMGITQFAADALTDITYVELPDVGSKIGAGDSIGEVESVKATSEVFSAFAGHIVEVNEALGEHPELINDDAFEEGWLVRMEVDSLDPLATLMTAKEYRSFLKAAT